MAVVIKPITVEVSKPNVFQAIAAKQNDCNSRFLKVTFVNEGEKIFISPSATVTINATRNDGESESFFGTVNSDGTATVPIHSWILELVGYVDCDVSIIEADSKLTCTTFSLLIEKATNNSEDISQDPQYDVLVNLIAEVQKTKENVSNAIKDSASGTTAIRLDGVSPFEHDISVKAMQEVKILGAGDLVCDLSYFGGDGGLGGIDIWDYELGEENQAKLFEIAEIIEENEFGFATIRFTDGSYLGDTAGGEIDINGLKVGDILLYENLDFTSYIYLSKLTEIGTEQVPLTNGEVVTEKIIARGEYDYEIDGIDSYYYETGWHYINGKWFYIIHEDWLCSTRVLKTTTETKTATVTRYGKNLIPFPYGFGNTTNAGVTVTINSDGGVTYNGTATAQINPYFVSNLLLHKGTYTLSGSPKGSSWGTQILIVQTNDASTILARDYGNGAKFTLDVDTAVRICLIVAKGATCSNLTIYPMLNEGTTALPYELYKEPVTFTADENGCLFLPSVSPTTTLIADSGVSMSAEYNVDTKAYIDKKFAELAAMIVNS